MNPEQASAGAIEAATAAAEALEKARLIQFTAVAEKMAEEAARQTASKAMEDAAKVAKQIISDAAETAKNLLKDNSEHITNVRIIANDMSYVKQDLGEVKIKVNTLAEDTEKRVKEERTISNKSYAPILAWTILLALLGIFGLAIAQKLVLLVGL